VGGGGARYIPFLEFTVGLDASSGVLVFLEANGSIGFAFFYWGTDKGTPAVLSSFWLRASVLVSVLQAAAECNHYLVGGLLSDSITEGIGIRTVQGIY